MSTLSSRLTDQPGLKIANELTTLGRAIGSFMDYLKILGIKSLVWVVLSLLAIPLLLVIPVLYTFYSYRFILDTRKLKKETKVLRRFLDSLGQNPSPAKFSEVLSKDSYTKFKESQTYWLQFIKQLKELSAKRRKKDMQELRQPSWIISFLMRPFTNFYEAFHEYNLAISELLRQLDESTQKGKYFDTIPENELWETRVKVYDYLM